ncbi:hypothetical protein CALCODRAFT_359386 [Calocera cornea HHB12733]|uniref:Uncharacterized protein n=1 Tax=Calocera cornea HHB12733 TaxID=1353952 RepID=A0A165ELZ1_9BASI|nr:hypothetical protein CALCODRAFT_359386 [Calocera cornea HHB12733]
MKIRMDRGIVQNASWSLGAVMGRESIYTPRQAVVSAGRDHSPHARFFPRVPSGTGPIGRPCPISHHLPTRAGTLHLRPRRYAAFQHRKLFSIILMTNQPGLDNILRVFSSDQSASLCIIHFPSSSRSSTPCSASSNASVNNSPARLLWLAANVLHRNGYVLEASSTATRECLDISFIARF